MSKLILYHGSDHIVKTPLFGKGNKNNDYGQGFYCTQHIELAKEWATKNNVDGYCNKYELETNGLKILDLTKEKYMTLKWLSILLEHREFDKTETTERVSSIIKNKFHMDILDYDLIIGYRADDSYFDFVQAFLSNTISLSSLAKIMKLGNLGLQYVLLSKKSFSQIKFTEYEKVDKSYYFKFKQRDEEASKQFIIILKNETYDESEIYAMDIIRKDLDLNDSRIQY